MNILVNVAYFHFNSNSLYNGFFGSGEISTDSSHNCFFFDLSTLVDNIMAN